MLEHNMDLWRERTQRQAEQKGFREGQREDIRKGRQKGRQEGLQKGRQEGIQKGRLEGIHLMILSQLEQRFGTLPQTVRHRVERISSIEELERLAKRILTAKTLGDLGLG